MQLVFGNLILFLEVKILLPRLSTSTADAMKDFVAKDVTRPGVMPSPCAQLISYIHALGLMILVLAVSFVRG